MTTSVPIKDLTNAPESPLRYLQITYNPFPADFLSQLPPLQAPLSSLSVPLESHFHKISTDPTRFFSFEFSFSPEVEFESTARQILFAALPQRPLLIYRNVVFSHSPIATVTTEYENTTFTISFTPTDAPLDTFRLSDITKSALTANHKFYFTVREFSQRQVVVVNGDDCVVSHEFFLSHLHNAFFVLFFHKLRRIAKETFYSSIASRDVFDVEQAFHHDVFFNSTTNRLEFVDQIAFDITPTTQTFTQPSGEVSIADYYASRGFPVAHPDQPLLVQEARRQGRFVHNFFVPEFMHATAQLKTADDVPFLDQEEAEIIRYLNASELFQRYGLHVSEAAMQCCGAYLEPVTLVTSRGEVPVDPTREVWDLAGAPLLAAPQLAEWVFYTSSANTGAVAGVHDRLMRSFRQMGVAPSAAKVVVSSARQIPQHIFEGIAKQRPQIVFGLFNRVEEIHQFKDFFEARTTIPTQCIDITERNTDKFASLARQIALKTGGVLWRVKGVPQDIALVGIATRDAGNRRAFVTVSVSVDPDATQYAVQTMLVRQSEAVAGLGVAEFLAPHLRGRPVRRVVVYRAGVSENMMRFHRQYEAAEVERACRDACGAACEVYVVVANELFPRRLRDANSPPRGGLVLQAPFVRQELNGFVLCPRLSTFRALSCAVTLAPPTFDMGWLVDLTYKACHLFQFHMYTSALPAPLMHCTRASEKLLKNAEAKAMARR